MTLFEKFINYITKTLIYEDDKYIYYPCFPSGYCIIIKKELDKPDEETD